MDDTSTSMEKILKLLYEESPLSPKIIAERLNLKESYVRMLLSHARSLGVVRLYKGIRGLYTLSSYGREFVRQKLEEASE